MALKNLSPSLRHAIFTVLNRGTKRFNYGDAVNGDARASAPLPRPPRAPRAPRPLGRAAPGSRLRHCAHAHREVHLRAGAARSQRHPPSARPPGRPAPPCVRGSLPRAARQPGPLGLRGRSVPARWPREGRCSRQGPHRLRPDTRGPPRAPCPLPVSEEHSWASRSNRSRPPPWGLRQCRTGRTSPRRLLALS